MKFIDESAVQAPSMHAVMAGTMADLIESIAIIGRMEASLAANKAELIEQARQWALVMERSAGFGSGGSDSGGSDSGGWNAEVRARRVVVSELACALRIPERTAETLVAESSELLGTLSATFVELAAGTISWRHARVVIDQARTLPSDAVAAFEAAVLPHARTVTVAKFVQKARIVRERMHPESINERAAKAAEVAFVEILPAPDGMVDLHAHVPAAEGHAIFNRISDLAKASGGPEDDRTLSRRRADALVDLLVSGQLKDGADFGIRATVLVTVPVLTLLGQSDEPATLEGYGPIDLETAKQLAAHAPSFIRILTHPETGTVLSVGRNRYGPPADLRTWLRVRDGTCRFPTCNRRARACELDHTRDWQYDGLTAHDNLEHLCPMHHHLKHHSDWAVRQLAGGVIEWTSPSGRVYLTEPETRMRAGS